MLPLPLRQAWRALRRAPAFTLAAVLCLALGVGATTTVLAVADAVLFRPLPVRDLERLVAIRLDLPKVDLLDTHLDPPGVEEVLARRDVFDGGAAYDARESNLTSDAREPARVRVTRTLGGYFALLGATAARGQLYDAAASRDPARRRTAVLTHAFWQRHFGGDPGVVGRTVRLNGDVYEIVGVAGPTLRFPRAADLYVPYPVDSTFAQSRSRLVMVTIARVRPGVAPARVDAALQAVGAGWAAADGASDTRGGLRLRAVPLATYLAGELRPITRLMLGAVALVLLVACANVACLQLVRATGRLRELAVRAAVGARLRDLGRPLAVESALLAALGGALGVAASTGALALLRRVGPAQYPQLADVRLDARVLVGALAATALSALLFGLAPLLTAVRTDPQEALRAAGGRGASAGAGRMGFLRAAVVTQLALALMLALGAGLLGRSFARLASTDPGFRPERVLSARFALPRAAYPELAQRMAAFDAVQQAVAATPGVSAAALSQEVPFGADYDSSPFDVPGRAAARDGEQPHAVYNMVSEDWFRVMGVALVRGRAFTRADDRNAPSVAVIDEQLAEQFFPGVDPIGRRLVQMDTVQIVGVVRRVAKQQLGERAKATIYYPLRQKPWLAGTAVVLRGALPPGAAERAVRAAVARVDRQVPVFDVRPMTERVAESVGGRGLATAALAGFAGIGLLLAALGLYGVLSYLVAQRTRELGVRAALGARAATLERMVLGSGGRLAGAGIGLGLLLFLAAHRVLAALLYGVGPADPLAFAGAAGVLGAAVLLASWMPARRASRVAPSVALRGD